MIPSGVREKLERKRVDRPIRFHSSPRLRHGIRGVTPRSIFVHKIVRMLDEKEWPSEINEAWAQISSGNARIDAR